MGFKCVAPGCRTGYSKEDANNVNVSLFKFPDKERSPERRKRWIARVPRKDWSPSENSRLCEKHFLPQDFKSKRKDKTRGRTSKRGELTRKVLNAGVIPSVWPNLPIHLTKDITTRTTNASSTSRESLVFAREAEIRKQDTFTSLTKLANSLLLKI